MGARGLVAACLSVLAAAVSIGSATVRSEADVLPRLSGKIWPNHPLTLRGEAMVQIGQAAALGQLPSEPTMGQIRRLAYRAPIEPEPFLVQAALAQKRGEAARAEQLLLQARSRDPRSPAARYLLADHYIRRGDIVAGLREMSVMTRFVKGSADQLVPGLVAYAATPGAVPKLRQIVSDSPDLEPALLSALASDADNADLVLAIAGPSTPAGGSAGQWRPKLLNSLVEQGNYDKAYSIWARFAGVKTPASGLFRPDFTPSDALPPFNWTLAQAGGLAEPSPRGGLHVIHYGRKETVLASQLLLLDPGRYELAMAVTGDVGADGQLRWRIRCLPSGRLAAEIPLTRSNAQKAGAQFVVPASGCGAQRIALAGARMDIPRSSDASISPLRLSRAGG